MLNKIAVTAVPIIAVLVLGSILWQNGGAPNSDHLCALTEDIAEGPYYIEGSPTKGKLGTSLDGEKLIISGSVLDLQLQSCTWCNSLISGKLMLMGNIILKILHFEERCMLMKMGIMLLKRFFLENILKPASLGLHIFM